jgi:hypothetical protein
MQEESVSEVRYYDVALSLPGERKKSRRAEELGEDGLIAGL